MSDFSTGPTKTASSVQQLLDWVHQDQRGRWDRGERVLAETYLEKHPALAENTELFLELIYGEILLREQCGEAPRLEEYQHRFPHLAQQLKDQFEVHAALEPSNRRDSERTLVEEQQPAEAKGPAPVLGSLPGYQILEELGRGGMGIVFRAWQESVHRVVAVKLLRGGELAGPDERARFRIEAEAVARLEHPNIVALHDVGEHRGQPFFVLEYVEGGSLARRLAGRSLAPREAAQLVEVLARAVDYAHRRGVIHRDLTPANILIQRSEVRGQRSDSGPASGRSSDLCPKITDFGLAKLLIGGAGTQTQTGAILGTPSYMAPEQASGRTKAIGPATDVYALGAILYEALTGRPPFKGEQPLDTLRQVVSQEPIRPSRLQPRIPRDLETICLKSMAKEPERRYPTAGDLADDLRLFLDGLPIRSRPVGRMERLMVWARRHPAAAALVFVSAIAAIALLVGGLIYDAQLHRALADVDEKQTALATAAGRIEELREEASRTLADAERNAYLSQVAAAREQLAAGNAGRAEELLDACPLGLRRWEWHYLRRQCRDTLLTFQAHFLGEAVNHLAFTADGRTLVTGGGNPLLPGKAGQVIVWDSATGERQLSIGPKVLLPVLGGSMLENGAWLSGGGIVRAGQQLAFSDAGGPVEGVAVSPDGEYLASASSRVDFAGLLLGTRPLGQAPEGEVVLRRARTGQVVARLPGYRSVAFSLTGRRLAVAGLDGAVHVWDLAANREVFATRPRFGGQVGSVVWSPDEKRLASVSSRVSMAGRGKVQAQSEIRLWDARTGALERTLPGHAEGTFSLAFSPDGRRLASAGGDWLARMWDVATGQVVQTFRGHSNVVQAVAFSPDGRWLAGGGNDQVVRVWDAETAAEVFTFRGHSQDVRSLAFVPAKASPPTALASGGGDGTVRFWDLRAGQGGRRFRDGHASAISSAALSPDGRTLATSGADWHLVLWDVASGRVLHTLPCKPSILAFSPDGKLLATAGGIPTALDKPGELKIWDVAKGRERCNLQGHTKLLTGVAFSPDGRRLVSASGNAFKELPGEVITWELTADGVRETNRFSPGGSFVYGVAWAPDGRRLALGAWDKGVLLCDPDTGTIHRTIQPAVGPINALAFSPDGRRLACGGRDGLVSLVDPESGEEMLQVRVHGDKVGVISVLTGLAFDPTGDRLASVNFDFSDGRGAVKLWDTRSGQELLSLPGRLAVSFSTDGHCLASVQAQSLLGPGEAIVWDATPAPDLFTLRGHAGIVLDVTVSPDGRSIACAQSNGNVLFWDPATGRPGRTLKGGSDLLNDVAYRPDGRQLATAGFDRTVRLWDTETGREQLRLNGHQATVWSVKFSRDGRLLASSGEDQTVRLWDAAAGTELHAFHGHSGIVWDVAFSPDGNLLASAGADHTIRLWDVPGRRLIRTLTGHQFSVRGVAFGPDGRLLASAAMDQTIKLWDVATGTALRTLHGHVGAVRRVAFSPDGRLLASAGFDRTARLWDTATGKELQTLHGHINLLTGVAFTPDGRRLVTSSYDQTVKVWQIEPVTDSR